MENSIKSYYEAWNEKELLEGLSKKESYILVKGEYKDKVKKLINTKLSDDELMGAELGSAGSLTILSELVHLLINSFSDQSKTEKQLENKIREYNFKLDDNKDILLYLRQFDF